MKKKLYRVIVDNDGEVNTMIMSGYSKKSVTKVLTDFYIKTNRMKDFSKFYVYLKQVQYIDGDYKTIE